MVKEKHTYKNVTKYTHVQSERESKRKSALLVVVNLLSITMPLINPFSFMLIQAAQTAKKEFFEIAIATKFFMLES